MDEQMLSILLKEQRAQAGQIARISANISLIEQRSKLSAQDQRKDLLAKMREVRLEVRGLSKKIDTQPIAFRQIMDTWWLRIAAIVALGLANIDLKQAIALVLQVK
jgi:hypothetical protein